MTLTRPIRRTPLAALAGAACVALLALAAAPAQAQVKPAATTDVSKVGEEQRTKLNLYLTPRQAADFVAKNKAKVLFLDVRTRAEAVFTGMATPVDALVPYVEFPEMHADWGWDENRAAYKYEPFNDFAPEVARRLKEKGLAKDDAIVLMCRSGDRSSRAANLLADLGYTRVYSVVGGFEGPANEKTGMRDVGGW
ncbi:MAG: rhodanese-like domain-containing protein, partial [Burkholderiaceae bacterium]|nr:rhodanese-like domain-containing protein [Burkholderiaceae bacterium]